MADGAGDARRLPDKPIERDGPARPDNVSRSVNWPETGNMQAHHQAANRQFKVNSERLQRAHGAEPKEKSVEPPQKQQAKAQEKAAEPQRLQPGDYGGLRRETAKAQTAQREQQVPEGKLTFARDRREREAAPKQQEVKEGELSFSRSRSGHDLSRGR